MPVWMQFLEEHPEFQWISLVVGLLGTSLYTVLFPQAVSIGVNLLNQETVRNAREKNRVLEFSCSLYEKQINRMWIRLTGLTVSLLLLCLSLSGFVLR